MRKIGLNSPVDITDKQEEVSSVVVPMPEPVLTPLGLKHMGDPEKLWIYRMSDGTPYGAVARWDPAGRRKEVRPIIWNGSEFISAGFGKNRPLLNSHVASSSPLAPVLIVEGEKTLDAASGYVPDGWVVVTWQGGSSAALQSDWSSMVGHPCVIWPDNDEAGIKAADAVRMALSKLGVMSSIVTMSDKFPVGWDLADELPVGNKDTITQVLRKNLKEVSLLEVMEVPEEKPSHPEEDSYLHYRAIGYNEQRYYVMPSAQSQPHPYTAKALMSEEGCIEIVNDYDYWDRHFGDDKGRINWKRAGAFIMKQCTDAGVYDDNKIRDQGVWTDKGRVVLHFGTKLYVDGVALNPAKMRSEYIYPSRHNLIEDWDGLENAAPDSYGRIIREACNLVRWDKKIYGDLLAGWIATAPICGGLPWRTHVWITGNQSSGKSTVVNDIVQACIGSTGIYPVGASTEAGIRSAIGNMAVPVIFDESEKDNSTIRDDRRQAVIQLMRQSSAETRGRIMKGSANHQSVTFSLRSAFLMSSIGVGLKEAADLTRTAVLTVRPLNAGNMAELKQQEEQYKHMQAATARITSDMPQRLLSRQVNQLLTIRKNVEVFKEVIAMNLGNRRLGDQIGTLLAGLFSLFSTSQASYKMCEKFIQNNDYDWDDFTKVKSMREDLALLYHLTNSKVRVDSSVGAYDRLIGELIEIGFGNVFDDNPSITVTNARNTLKRLGIIIDTDNGGIWVGTQITGMKSLMATSDYSEGWAGVLSRHPYAKKSDNAIKFAGVSSRAIYLPKEEFFKTEG